MHSIIKAPKFVFTLKPKIQTLQQQQTLQTPQALLQLPTLPYDMLNYIVSFIDVSDTYTLLSYLMAIPCSNYEIKKSLPSIILKLIIIHWNMLLIYINL